MIVRTFKPGDANALAALFHASVREGGIRDYSPEQVAAWSPSKFTPERYARKAEGRVVFVAEGDDGQPVGYGDLEPNGHIDHFYSRPDKIGTGVGSALYAAIEATGREARIAVLFVEASEAARRLFERRGFDLQARNDFVVNGVAIHNYRMSKTIG